MKDSISKLHSLFSKATMVIDKRGVRFVYSNPAMQDVLSTESRDYSELKEILTGLLLRSDKVVISFNPGFSSTISFAVPGLSEKTVVFDPLEHQISYTELREVLSQMETNTPEIEENKKNFVEFFMGVDITDEEEFGNKLFEWVFENEHKSNVFIMSHIARFRKMRYAAMYLQTHGFQDIECVDASGDFNGCVVIYMNADNAAGAIFSEENKQKLVELLELCSLFEIDIGIEDPVFNLEFYV